jgi:hypothetical protein
MKMLPRRRPSTVVGPTLKIHRHAVTGHMS